MKSLERLVSVPLFAISLVGCNDLSSLTDEERATVSLALDYGTIELSFVHELAFAANPTTVFDDQGNTGVAAFADATLATASVLEVYFAEDRIVSYDPAVMESKDGDDGFHRDYLVGESIIALNATLLAEGYIHPYVVHHEGAHDLYGNHSAALQKIADAITSDTDRFSSSFATAVIAAMDFPFLVTFFYHAADTCFGNPHDYVTRVIINQEGSIQDGTKTPQEAYDDLTLLVLEPEEEWASQLLDTTYAALPYFATFGITQEEFYSALIASDLFEGQQQIYKEGIDAFVATYPDEEILTLEEMGK